MSRWDEHCSLCDRGPNSYDVRAIVVDADGDTAVCDVCIKVLAEAAQKCIERNWQRLKDFAP